MVREWEDREGRRWRIDASGADVDGGPYLVTFSSGERIVHVEYPGPRAPEGLTGKDLEGLFHAATAEGV